MPEHWRSLGVFFPVYRACRTDFLPIPICMPVWTYFMQLRYTCMQPYIMRGHCFPHQIINYTFLVYVRVYAVMFAYAFLHMCARFRMHAEVKYTLPEFWIHIGGASCCFMRIYVHVYIYVFMCECIYVCVCTSTFYT
jgi:hypothetical protein